MGKKDSNWRNINPFDSKKKYVDVTLLQNEWVNVLPPHVYYGLKNVCRREAWVFFFLFIVVGLVLVSYG